MILLLDVLSVVLLYGVFVLPIRETGDCLHESHRGVGAANAVRVPEREEKSHVPVAVSAET